MSAAVDDSILLIDQIGLRSRGLGLSTSPVYVAYVPYTVIAVRDQSFMRTAHAKV